VAAVCCILIIQILEAVELYGIIPVSDIHSCLNCGLSLSFYVYVYNTDAY
jgi:hypothetical protein